MASQAGPPVNCLGLLTVFPGTSTMQMPDAALFNQWLPRQDQLSIAAALSTCDCLRPAAALSAPHATRSSADPGQCAPSRMIPGPHPRPSCTGARCARAERSAARVCKARRCAEAPCGGLRARAQAPLAVRQLHAAAPHNSVVGALHIGGALNQRGTAPLDVFPAGIRGWTGACSRVM